MKPKSKEEPALQVLTIRSADNEEPLEWNDNGHAALYVYAALADEDNDLIYIGFMRKTPDSTDYTLFCPLMPPPEFEQKILSELRRHASYSRPPAEYSLGPQGAIQYNGSSNGRIRFLPCMSRPNVANHLFKVSFKNLVCLASQLNAVFRIWIRIRIRMDPQ